MYCSVKPIYDRIVVKPLDSASTTPSGIIIPEQARTAPIMGTVLAVGDGVKELKVDDMVIYGKYEGKTIKFKDEKYLILLESHVLAILEKNDEKL